MSLSNNDQSTVVKISHQFSASKISTETKVSGGSYTLTTTSNICVNGTTNELAEQDRPAETGNSCPVLAVPTVASCTAKPRKICKFKKKNDKKKPMKLDLIKGKDHAYFTLESMDYMTSSPCAKSIDVQFQLGVEVSEENDKMNCEEKSDSNKVDISNSTTSQTGSEDSGISSNGSSPDTSPDSKTVQPKSVNSCMNRMMNGSTSNRNLIGAGMNLNTLGMTMHSSLMLQRASTQSNNGLCHRSTNSLSLYSYATYKNNNFGQNKMSEIIPGKLYVGSLENLNDTADFEKYFITRIVTAMHDFPSNMHNLPSIQKCKDDNKISCGNPEAGHLIISVKDRGHENIDKFFDQVNSYIDGNQTGATYIHCHSGISRSVTLCMAYLLAKNMKPTVSEAISFMQEKRSKSCPNFGFLGQLTSYIKTKEQSGDSGFSEDVEMP